VNESQATIQNWMQMLRIIIDFQEDQFGCLNTDWTDRCRTLLVKATSISSTSVVPLYAVLMISHDRCPDITLKLWTSLDQILLHISLTTHNTIDWKWSVVKLLSWALCMITTWALCITKLWIGTCMNFSTF